jgi:hypothetical protein
MAKIARTSSEGTDKHTTVFYDRGLPFPWDWPAESRRLLLECVEAWERSKDS